MRSKKLRYAATSSAITVLVIAAVMIFNVIFSALAGKFLWYADMTGSEVFSLSDDAIAYLDQVSAPIDIYFAADEDMLINGTYSEYTRFVYQTARLMADRYDNINVECHNVYKEYDFFKPYADTAASSVPVTSVIVKSGTEFRLYALDAFYIFDENYQNIWAYNGENKFVAGILQVTADDMPIVCFTTAHGERSVEGDSKAMAGLFADAGFEVREIDLASEDVPDGCRIMITNDPVYDFIGREAGSDKANEIAKLDAFLDGYGCYMIFADYDHASKLYNLNEFLEEWGIKFDTGAYLRDHDHSTSVDGATIVAEYVKDEDNSLGASIYSDIAALDTMPKTVARCAMPINIMWNEGGGLTGTRRVFPVLCSYDSAETMRNGEVMSTGQRNLMTLSRDRVIIDNNYYYSYVLACGASTFTDETNLLSQAYANSDILYSAMRSLGKERIVNDIPYKAFDKTSVDITTSQANGWAVALTAVMPAIVAVSGIVVIARRKRR